jgi:hypothetical protein
MVNGEWSACSLNEQKGVFGIEESAQKNNNIREEVEVWEWDWVEWFGFGVGHVFIAMKGSLVSNYKTKSKRQLAQ